MRVGFSICFSLLLFSAKAQQTDTLPYVVQTTNQDTIYFHGKLPMFEIDSCLGSLLEDVVDADMNASYFSEGRSQIVYTIDFRDHEDYIDMFLMPMRVSKSGKFDYFGALKIKGALFLCRGNYRDQALFHKSNLPDTSLTLKRPKKMGEFDAIDNAIFDLMNNISLFGTYIECTGLKIVTSIYIQNKLPGYELDKKNKPSASIQPRKRKEQHYDSIRQIYNDALGKLSERAASNGSFKESVFITENAFFNNTLPTEDLDDLIAGLVSLCREWKEANPLKRYSFKDSTDLLTNLSIYKALKDTITVLGARNEKLYHLPLSYDFDDFFGRQQWSNMFVSKLLISQRGNCHSLPYLYKILADELGATCWLSLAPNHLYIKNRSKRLGWYNTELTSGSFPIDAWITASGYIPIKAVQNGIYMDTLSNQQAIALCILDLAKGYEFQTKNYEDGFILKCCDLALKYHPVNVQALLLKAETLKRIYEKEQAEGKANATATYQQMENLYVKLFDLGYREMPEEMYMSWLLSVTKEGEKYSNKELNKVLAK